MKKMISWMDRRFYPDYICNWDDALFREHILQALKPAHFVLDLGAGAGIIQAMDFRGKANSICGVDPDPRVKANPYLNQAEVGVGESIPFADSMFDLVFADNVMEHVADPQQVFAEVHRVLKPDGLFYFKTPNKWHYMPFIAQLTPLWFHKYVNKLRGRATVNTFPTLYRVNSSKTIYHYARLAGFEVKFVKLIEGRPEYLRFSMITYLMGLLYERLVNSFNIFSRFRILTIACLQKIPQLPELSH